MTLNLNALLVKWSEERASHKAFIYLGHGDKTEAEVTFSELYRQSSKIAHYLFEKHTSASTILLLFNSPFEFIKAFFGCLLAGKIAIPMFPPRNRKKIDRLVRILQNANSSLILTSNKVKTKLFERNDLGIELDFQVEEIEQALDTEFSGVFDPLGVPQNEVAMLQYTSGSAGVPKGVIVTHQNILANQSVIKESFGHSDQTVFGTWLPFFHDMGLVGNILQPFYLGITCVLFTPEGFVQKPIRWIKAISDFGVTTSGAPNFAYDLCTARIDDAQLSDIDLSSWSVAYNGAEPISPNTLDRFTKKFEKCGFKRSSFFPCYGMAETTLIATGGDYRKDPVVVTIDGSKLAVGEAVTFGVPTDGNSKQIVGCGKAWQDNHLKIVDPKNCTSLPD
ncbi:MAG: AMP-binding protein, partial [Bacteroidota bacterium]